MRKTALITWASSGIGKATAELLAIEWFDLLLLARRINKLEEIKSDLESKYNIVVDIKQCDVTNFSEVEKIAKEISQPVHALINNAWLALGRASFQESSRDELESMVKVNIMWLTKIAHSFMPQLIEGKGHLVNISSISWHMPYPGGHVYGWTKSYVNQLSNNLRIDLLGTWVRITDIAPGKVNTEFSVVRFKGDQQIADNEYIWFRELKAEDIARSVSFCVTQPAHVNIDYMCINCTDRARPGFADIKKT